MVFVSIVRQNIDISFQKLEVIYMRNAVREYIGLTDTEKQELLGRALIVLDTNVLLNLYRFSKSTREALLDALRSYENQLWMPYQIAIELMRKRPKIIDESVKKYGSLITAGNGFVEKCSQELRINPNDPACIELRDYITSWIEDKKQNNLLVTSWNDDSILIQILKLFDGKVGKAYSDKELEDIKKDGKLRYDKKIPPGYKDANKSTENNDNNAYGDLIYWKQILDYAKETSSDVVLVTGDKKDDWWAKTEDKKIIGPRPELIKEFYDVTSKTIYMYDMNQFIQFAGKELDKKVVDEIQSISMGEEDEELTQGNSFQSYKALHEEIIALEEKNANRLSSIKGYERLINNGTATSSQISHYHSTVASYKREKKQIKQLKERLRMLPIPDEVAKGLYWLTR